MRSFARLIVLLAVLLIVGGAPAMRGGTAITLQAEAAPIGCPSTATPLAALPPAIPIWCQTPGQAPATLQQGANSWLDDFNFGTTPVTLGDGYRTYDSQEAIGRTQFWRQNNHWMMDLQPKDSGGNGLLGGGMMRPDRSFRFENGKLVVESDVAAGITQYGAGADIWPEVVVTPAPAPTGKIPDGLYAYGQFGGHWSFGCRYQPTRVPVCSLYNPDGQAGDPALFGNGSGRVWEMSNFEQVGAASFGGTPDGGGPLDKAWRTCNGSDPDLNCRDRFRMELTKTSVTIYVNGTKYFEQTGLKVPFPDALVNGNVYVYFAGWEVRQSADTIRYHWDRLAINPDAGPLTGPPVPQPAPAPQPAIAPVGAGADKPAGTSRVGVQGAGGRTAGTATSRLANTGAAASQPAGVAHPVLKTVGAVRGWVGSWWLLLVLLGAALGTAVGAGWWLRGRRTGQPESQ